MATEVKRQTFTENDIIRLIGVINGLGKLSDDELTRQAVANGVPADVNRFMTSIFSGQSSLTASQATTLLKLTPIFNEHRDHQGVNRLILCAAPKVKEMYKRSDPKDRIQYGKALKIAAETFFNNPSVIKVAHFDQRQREFDLLKDFAEDSKMIDALCEKYIGGRRFGFTERTRRSMADSPMAARVNQTGQSYNRMIRREFDIHGL